MKVALKSLVQSDKYQRFDFENDTFAARINGDQLWELLERIVAKCGPILLLLRLADSNAATLCKLKGTVEYLKTKFVDTGSHTLEDKISVAFNNRAPEFECDISNAAYVLDPQFVSQSRSAGAEVMYSFWRVSKNVLGITDNEVWRRVRGVLVTELASFRMHTSGFAFEEYDTDDTIAFWVAAGCFAPTLRKLAFRLCALPCSSGEAERNWQEVKQNLTKKHNRLVSKKLEKMVFVRRFIRMKRLLCNGEDNTGFTEWAQEMLKDVALATGADDPPDDDDSDVDDERHDDANEVVIFQDSIEPGERAKIDGKEPGQPPVPLSVLKKDNAARSWLFNKYYNIHFVDKNPEGDGDDLEDEALWEHRIIKNVVWWRRHGHALETALKDALLDGQSIERYTINESLINMIRSSPYNVNRIMASQRDQVLGTNRDPLPAPTAADGDTVANI